uniref:Uncharacterized protein n=1 Tax=Arion vulgaris TaxID=1028688 RepID=A0A0B6YQ58_9EUPU
MTLSESSIVNIEKLTINKLVNTDKGILLICRTYPNDKVTPLLLLSSGKKYI